MTTRDQNDPTEEISGSGNQGQGVDDLIEILKFDDRFVFYPFPPDPAGEPLPYSMTQQSMKKSEEVENKEDIVSAEAVLKKDDHNAPHRPLLMYLARDKSNKTLKAVKGDCTSLKLETETIPQNLWPAAAPFARWMLKRPELFRGKHILELGSGVGLAGLAAACTGAASVTLTDISTVSLAMMRLGVQRSRELSVKSSVFVEELAWGSTESYSTNIALKVLPQLLDNNNSVGGVPCFDLVIGCDVFYFNSSLVSGLQTAAMALRPSSSIVKSEESGTRSFYCASVVRSDRMDSDLEVVPERQGFSGGELLDLSSREGLPDELRMFQWSLEA